jgi:hypothetical protein|uniref:Uncharacterized protein n=1 Tax=Zea mays TaxID=4577 RepID=A0A804PCI8_MAIZE
MSSRSDVGDTIVACLRWTGLSPMEDNAEECDALSRGSNAHRRHRRRGFCPRSPQHNVRPRPRSKQATSVVVVVLTPHTNPSRGATTRRLPQQPQSCVGLSSPLARHTETEQHQAACNTLPRVEATVASRHQPWQPRSPKQANTRRECHATRRQQHMVPHPPPARSGRSSRWPAAPSTAHRT